MNPGHAFVAFKGDAAAEHARKDPKKAKLNKDDRVDIVSVVHSTKDLNNASSAIVKKLKKVLAKDLDAFQTSVNVEANLVDVSIDASASDQRAAIEHELAAEVEAGLARITFGADTEQVDDANVCSPDTSLSTRNSCHPIRGGLQIKQSGGGVCSSGFVFRNSSGYRYLSTAAHCGNTGTRYYHGAVPTVPPTKCEDSCIGDLIFSSKIDGGTIDAALIDLENTGMALPNNSVFRYGASDSRVTAKITNPDASLLYRILCVEGATGGRSCGTLLSVNATHTGGGVTTEGLGMTDAQPCGGDSGAPVVRDSSTGAYGLHKGRSATGGAECGGQFAYFSWTSKIEEQSGFEVLVHRATERIKRGQSLRGVYEDQWIVSPDLGSKAVMQTDGNFVVYGPSTYCGADLTCWTETRGGPGTYAVMQNDGNFVLYDPAKSPQAFCSTGTASTGGSYAKQKNDGTLGIYNGSDGNVWYRGPGHYPTSCGTP